MGSPGAAEAAGQAVTGPDEVSGGQRGQQWAPPPPAIPSSRDAHALCAQVINSLMRVTRSLRGRGGASAPVTPTPGEGGEGAGTAVLMTVVNAGGESDGDLGAFTDEKAAAMGWGGRNRKRLGSFSFLQALFSPSCFADTTHSSVLLPPPESPPPTEPPPLLSLSHTLP